MTQEYLQCREKMNINAEEEVDGSCCFFYIRVFDLGSIKFLSITAV